MKVQVIEQLFYNWHADAHGNEMEASVIVGHECVTEIITAGPGIYRAIYEDGSMMDILNANTVHWITVEIPETPSPTPEDLGF